MVREGGGGGDSPGICGTDREALKPCHEGKRSAVRDLLEVRRKKASFRIFMHGRRAWSSKRGR